MIPDLNGNGRALVIFDRVNLEPVRQRRVFEGQRRNRYRPVRGGIFRAQERWRESETKEQDEAKEDFTKVRYRSEVRRERERNAKKSDFRLNGLRMEQKVRDATRRPILSQLRFAATNGPGWARTSDPALIKRMRLTTELRPAAFGASQAQAE